MEFKLRPRREAGADVLEPLEAFASAPRDEAVTQLVAALIEATGLLPPERVAAVRARAGIGSFSDALLTEGAATSDGVARVLATRYHLPLVDLHSVGVTAQARALI